MRKREETPADTTVVSGDAKISPQLNIRPAYMALRQCHDLFVLVEGPRGCVAGDTRIYDPSDDSHPRIDYLYLHDIAPTVQTMFGPEEASVPFLKGHAHLYRFRLASGKQVKVHPKHMFLTDGGWAYAENLKVGDTIVVHTEAEFRPRIPMVNLAKWITNMPGDPDYIPPATDDILEDSIYWMDRIVSIAVSQDLMPFYDLTVKRAHHYIANGILHHNTAKTTNILVELMLRGIEYPGSRILLSRMTRTDLSKTILVTLEEQVFPMFDMKVPGKQSRTYRTEYQMPNGTVIVPVSGEDPARLLSSEWTFAYIAEAIEWPFETILKMAASMRYLYAPGRRERLPDWSQIIVDTNPGGPIHPLNLKAEEIDPKLRRVTTEAEYWKLQQHNFRRVKDPAERWKRIVTKHHDNAGYWSFSKWDWTPLGKKYVTEILSVYDGFQKQRWVDGDWVQESGAVFPNWNESIHLCDDFEPPDSWQQVLGYDPGFGTTAVLWLARSPDMGIHVIDEIYEGGKTVEEHCKEILKRGKWRNVSKNLGDPNEMFSSRAQGVSCANQARQLGLRFVPWPADKGASFDAGVDRVRSLLHATIKGQKPYLKVCRRCKGLRANMSTWSFKKTRGGEPLIGADKYEDGNDHAIDVLRGCVTAPHIWKKSTFGV